MASSEDRLQLAQAGMDAFNDGDMTRMLAALTEDIEVYASPEMANAGHYSGHDGFVTWITAWTDAWEEVSAEVTENTPVGERHVVTTVPSGGQGPRRDRGEHGARLPLRRQRARGLHLPRDAPDAARRRSGWRGARSLLGADAAQRQAEPGLDLGQRVPAAGDQQDHLVGWEVTELVLERLSGVVSPTDPLTGSPAATSAPAERASRRLGFAAGVVLGREPAVEPVARDRDQQAGRRRLAGESAMRCADRRCRLGGGDAPGRGVRRPRCAATSSLRSGFARDAKTTSPVAATAPTAMPSPAPTSPESAIDADDRRADRGDDQRGSRTGGSASRPRVAWWSGTETRSIPTLAGHASKRRPDPPLSRIARGRCP